MNISNEKQITRIWNEFADAGFVYLSHNGEQNNLESARKKRKERLPIRQKLLQKFLDGKSESKEFRSEMASEAGTHSLWGFSGPSGGMFFNQLVDASQPDGETEITELLQEILTEPENKEAARNKINRLRKRVEAIRELATDVQSAPSAGSIPYFVSYFWQLQSPDEYPVYYVSMRNAFSDLSIWEPSGDIAEDYIDFCELNEEVRDILEEHTEEEIHLWTIERLFLFWLSRNELDEPDEGSEIWQVAPDQSLSLWRAWSEHGVMSIGWSSLGDIEGISDEEIADGLDVAITSNDVTTIRYFGNEISPGDVVVAKHGRNKVDGIGVVKTRYEHNPKRASKLFPEEYTSFHNLIGVEWIFDFVENYGAPIEKPGDITGFVQPTVRKYPHYEKLKEFLLDQFPDLSEGFERIETRRAQLSVNNIDTIPPGLDSQTGTENTKPDPTEELSISLEPEMIVGLHFPDTMATSLSDLLQQIEAALNAGNHVMFTGPPGTGKTELAEQVAEHLAAEHEDLFTGAHLTTATADWSTFETIGGYMPARNGEGELEFRAGQLLRRFKRNDHQRNDITVIDEINRADIDKAFGQLFTVLSGQKVYLPYEVEGGNEVMIRSAAGTDRSADIDESVAENGDETVDELPEEEFIIPESWRLMATMNSYDKTSLYDMSFAFMRRFTFIRVGAPKIPEPTDEDPSPEEFIAGYLDKWDNVNLDPNNMVLQGVLDAWRIMNRNEDARSLGPAIAMDMLGFVSGLSYTTKPERNRAVARAVTAYVFPQLEGMIDKQRDPVIEKLKESDHIDGELISEAAAEQFQ